MVTTKQRLTTAVALMIGATVFRANLSDMELTIVGIIALTIIVVEILR